MSLGRKAPLILSRTAFDWRLGPYPADLKEEGRSSWQEGWESPTFSTYAGGVDLGVDGPFLRCWRSLSSMANTDLFLFHAAFSVKASLATREARSFFEAIATRRLTKS